MMTKDEKRKLIGDYQINGSDTGSADVQVAVLTHRIMNMTEHLKKNRKDFASRRGLTLMVSKRRGLLDYLARTDRERYQSLVQRLNLRK